MTNAKAINILANVVETAKGRSFITDEAISEAFDMAIKAMEAQEAKTQLSAEGTTSDLISRQAAIDAFEDTTFTKNEILRRLSELPPAHPVITCDGCRFVGTYDTDLPCCYCIRREKDCYEKE